MAESDLAAALRCNPQDEHVAAALRDVRGKLEAAGDAADYSFDGDKVVAGVVVLDSICMHVCSKWPVELYLI
jgi:hypothetical protein